MKFFYTALIAAVAQANLFELDTLVDSLSGESSMQETIFRKPRIVQQAAPSSAIDYEDKVTTLDWKFSSSSERASTRLFPTNPTGVEAEDIGLWGTSTMYMDQEGVNWLTVDLNAGWDTKWTSNKAGNSFYSGIYWTLQNMDKISIDEANQITVDFGTQWEVAIQGAVRESTDTTKSTTPALKFDPLVEATTGFSGQDFSQQGSAIFQGDLNTDASTPTSWEVLSTTSFDVVSGKTKYIVGMGVTAARPFVPTSDRSSSLEIKNQNDYAICSAQWVNSNDSVGQFYMGCDKIVVDLPVPEIQKEDKNNTAQPEQSTSGAYSLTYSALAAVALIAINY